MDVDFWKKNFNEVWMCTGHGPSLVDGKFFNLKGVLKKNIKKSKKCSFYTKNENFFLEKLLS